MVSCWDGGITLSLVPISYQEGIVFHAGVVDTSLSAPKVTGRCVAASTAPSRAGRSLANVLGNRLWSTYRSVPAVGGSVLGTKLKTFVGSGLASAEVAPASCRTFSPSSGAKASRYTRALTFA